MKCILLLYINQLFDKEYIPDYIDEVYVLEHPKFYGKGEQKMNFNKKKIILHRGSLLSFLDTYSNYHHISYEHFKYPTFNNNDIMIYVFDPVDFELQNELVKTYDKKRLKLLDTPMFLNTLKDCIEETTTQHSTFYKHQLKRHHIKHIDKSYDEYNRNSIPKQHDFDFKCLDYEYTKGQSTYLKKAKEFCKRHFKHNYGSMDNFYMPITRTNALSWCKQFYKERFKHFGSYQDAILPKQPLIFHSLLSPLLNIGLITPKEVLKMTQSWYKKVDISTYEGFIRQLVGWREFERYIYLIYYTDIINTNYFNHKHRITKHWYEGTTEITPVDITIRKAFKYGYLHHIERLMVMCNSMNLCRIQPNDVYRWFMEFSIDSYEWVMVGCVYSMGMWSDGGLTMRKPYLSSSSYIDKMSGNRFIKDGWRDLWDALFYDFIVTHKTKLKNTPYKRNLYHWNKKTKQEQQSLHTIATHIIRQFQ